MARPKPDTARARKAQEYRNEKGLSFRRIAKKMKSNVKTVWRWCQYELPAAEKGS